MKAVAEIQVIRVGFPGRSQLVVEGDLEDIFAAVRRIHETLHAEGTVRLSTFLKIGTRTDKDPDLEGKLF